MRLAAPSRCALRGQRVRSAAPRPVAVRARRLHARADAEPAKPAPAVLTSAVPLPAVSAHVTCGTLLAPTLQRPGRYNRLRLPRAVCCSSRDRGPDGDPAEPPTVPPPASLLTCRLTRFAPRAATPHAARKLAVPEVREPPPAEDLAALQKILAETKAAQAEYAHFSQEQVRRHRQTLHGSNAAPQHAARSPAHLARSCAPLRAAATVCCPAGAPWLSCAPPLTSLLRPPQVDKIFKAAALAANAARIPLAKLAAQETGMGVVEDKVIKIAFSSEFI